MIPKPDRAQLIDMVEHAELALEILRRGDDAAIVADRILYAALCRAIEIIGEAANQIAKETQARFAEIDWSGVIGMRHRLIHGYASLSPLQVARLARENIPPLVAQLATILGSPTT